MKRCTHLTLAMGTVTLLAMLLVLAVDAQPTAHADGNTIKVPGDYPTIQKAIDAAAEGDEIWVKLGFYDGNLSIDKGISLIGGWNDDFTARNVPAQTSIIDVSGVGRGISVTTATSDTVVTIDGFTIKDGNATGLGGAPEPTSLVAEILYPGEKMDADILVPARQLSPAEHLTRLRVNLASVVKGGLYPGGIVAYQDTIERAEQHFNRTENTFRQPSFTTQPSQDTVDCGGAIYSWNASLHLLNSVILGNMASYTGSGQGGGVCVGQSASSGTHIAGNIFRGNIASTASGDTNPGGAFGYGGGLYVAHVPGAVIEDNTFEGNVASNSSGGPDGFTVGNGGGLYVYSSDNVALRRNVITRNSGSHGWDAFSGNGGGVYLHWADGASVSDNMISENLAALHGICVGGGMLVLLSDNVLIEGNEVNGNWACLVARDDADIRGGGIMVVTSNRVTVSDNTLKQNTAAVSGPNIGTSSGGGLNIEEAEDVRITGNRVQHNMACQTGIGSGGGVSVWGVKDSLVAGNLISDNVGSLSGGYGAGGGLLLRLTQNSTVSNNVFQENLGVAEGEGHGGGGVAISYDLFYSPSVNTILDANSFFGNKDSVDLNHPSLGGGACFARSDGFTFTNNVVAENTGVVGSALFLGQTRNTAITNNTLVENHGASSVFVSPLNDPPIDFTNNIVVSHTVGISVTEGATATVRYTLWDGNGANIGGGGVISETHSLTGDPAFVTPSDHDYHLEVGSPAIDAGDPVGVPPAPDHDQDGVTRPRGMAADLGAYEWKGHYLYLTLVE